MAAEGQAVRCDSSLDGHSRRCTWRGSRSLADPITTGHRTWPADAGSSARVCEVSPELPGHSPRHHRVRPTARRARRVGDLRTQGGPVSRPQSRPGSPRPPTRRTTPTASPLSESSATTVQPPSSGINRCRSSPSFADAAAPSASAPEVSIYASAMRPRLGEVLHFSEDPQITEFVPHVARTATDQTPYVWAVDAVEGARLLVPSRLPAGHGLVNAEHDGGRPAADPRTVGRASAHDRVRVAPAGADHGGLRLPVRRRRLRALRTPGRPARLRGSSPGLPDEPTRARRRPADTAPTSWDRGPPRRLAVALVDSRDHHQCRFQRHPPHERPRRRSRPTS